MAAVLMSKVTEIMSWVTEPTEFLAAVDVGFKSETIHFLEAAMGYILLHPENSHHNANNFINHPAVWLAQLTIASTLPKAQRNASNRIGVAALHTGWF